ncbi:uncharacterized protein METZ01_LOCUS182965, partial [marine metagenome]
TTSGDARWDAKGIRHSGESRRPANGRGCCPGGFGQCIQNDSEECEV